MSSYTLVKYDAARHALAAAHRVDEAKDIRDKALAVAAYARQAKDEEMLRWATEIKLRAERRCGELLLETAKAGQRHGKADGRPGKSTPAGGHLPTLPQLGISPKQRDHWQKVARIPHEKFETLLSEAGAVQQRLTTAVLAGKPHIAQNAGEPEWYTPPDMLAAAREVLGQIDLDPASHPDAQTQVHAARYFTREMDGLSKPWKGRVWLNPPYSQPAVALFCTKLVAAYKAEQITGAISLTNNATETEWGQALLNAAESVCFPNGRVKFWAPGREAVPLQGQMLCYFGEDRKAFRSRFATFGHVR